jgi:hypothetical protein
LDGEVTNPLLQDIDLLVGEVLIHGAVVDAIAMRMALSLGVLEAIDQNDVLDEVTSD